MTQTPKYRLLRLCCFAIWGGMLVVGLWPFNFFPRNKVEWLGNKNGIRFDWDGQVYSADQLTGWEMESGTHQMSSLSIEMWLLPSDKTYRWFSVILAMYDPARRENFTIAQYQHDLELRGRLRDHDNHARFGKMWVDDILQKGRERFVTVTSGPQGTAIYLEAVREKLYPHLTLTADNFSGQLLVGHSPAERNPWAGELLGLAIYNKALTADEVSQHYKAWSKTSLAELATNKGILALYPFDERAGDLIHNHADSGPNLVIPRRFYILHRRILAPSFKLHRSDLGDVAINILGFIPFGLFVSAYLYTAARLPRYRAVLLTVVIGGMTSLTIEFLQAYLPSRDSSLMDVINNVLGTTMGAMLLKPTLLLARLVR